MNPETLVADLELANAVSAFYAGWITGTQLAAAIAKHARAVRP